MENRWQIVEHSFGTLFLFSCNLLLISYYDVIKRLSGTQVEYIINK